MSNSLIPYSFTPGTKAKAQEVNANFIALSEKIEENRAFTTEQIAETVQKIQQTSDDTELKKADTNLGNTKLISNCILDAPNGVVSASGNIITVKKGLKLLLPNGFNEDGTAKSITHELTDDVNVTTVQNNYINCVYVTQQGCKYAQRYLCSEFSPTDARGIWYRPSKNITYLYNAGTSKWEEINAIVIALYENKAGTVALKEVEKPTKLLTNADRTGIVNMMMPRYNKRVGKPWNTLSVATTNGWFYIFSSAQCNNFNRACINGLEYTFNWVREGDQASSTIIFPLKRGDTYYVSGDYLRCSVYFIPMEGDM